MARVDFDQYAGQYEAILAAQTNFFDGDSNYFARYKIELAQQPVGQVEAVLDFGCGIGRSMTHLREVFPKADIVGCDPSAESLAIAREQNPSCRFVSMDELSEDTKRRKIAHSLIGQRKLWDFHVEHFRHHDVALLGDVEPEHRVVAQPCIIKPDSKHHHGHGRNELRPR